MPTTTPFNNLITFSRGSNATVTGSNGLIQWAPNNLLTFSEQFDNAAWVTGLPSPAPVTANTAVAPDGTVTADTVAPAIATPSRRNQSAVTAGAVYVASVWVKAAPTGSATHFRLTSNNTIAWNTGASSKIALSSDWQRVSITWTQTGSSLANIIIGASDVAGTNDPDCYGNVLVWGAQLELGSTATTYNPTTVKNLLGFSEAFDNAAWTKSNASIVTGAQANPVNGLFTAQKLMENTANSVHRFIVGATLTAIPYTLSIYAKAAERNWIAVGNTSDGQLAHFNLTNGTVGTILGGATAAITNIGSGWYRCSVTFTPTAGSRTLAVWLASADNTLTYTGDGNSGVYIYGAQLSDSASLDPYVPTPGAAPSSTAFYGPRFDFDPVTLQPRGLLVEEQRTNLLLQSEAFGTTWLVSNATISSNVATSPDGTSNADKLIDNANPAQHFVYQSVVKAASSITYTLTSYMKSAEYTRSRLFLHDGAGNGFQADYNLATGTAGAAVATGAGWSAGSSAITAAGNGWYRCVITATSNTAVSVESRINVLDAAGNANFTGTGTSGIFLYGAQLEAGAFATSYIPTVASTVTRSADVATITGQNFAQWFNAAEGAIVISADTASWASIPIVAGYNPSSTASFVYFQVNTANTWNGTTVLSTAAGTVANNVPAKVATAYTASARAITLNGGTVASDANSIGTASVLALGAAGNPAYSSQRLNGHIQSIRFIPARAADFQLQGLTT